MKIKITFKDPDGVYDSITQAARGSLPAGLSAGERDAIMERRYEEATRQLRLWIKYGEYVTIEFDTDAKTATVLPI